MKLEGKKALVTGASRGIGRAIALALAAEGADVVVNYAGSEAAAKEVAAEIEAMGRKAFVVQADISSNEAATAMVDTVVKEFGRIDILVNNAGITRDGLLMRMKEEDWDLTFDVNVKGLMQMCREFVKRLKAKGLPGNIVNVSSNGAKVCFDNMADYNASKAAVMNLTQSMALEWAADHINVNAVCPGAVDTAMLRKCMDESIRLFGGSVEEMRKTWGPPQLGRLIQPYEVGRVIRFLASEDAVIIRGQSISVDGGNTRW